jgi:hypothetical protein
VFSKFQEIKRVEKQQEQFGNFENTTESTVILNFTRTHNGHMSHGEGLTICSKKAAPSPQLF